MSAQDRPPSPPSPRTPPSDGAVRPADALVRVKICGVTTVDDALVAEAAGADAIGLIFAARSRRRLTPDAARRIGEALGPWTARVGVFVEGSDDEILDTVRAARLDVVQLHGDVSSARLERLSEHVRVVRALRFHPDLDPRAIAAGDGVLLDGPEAGSGRPFDWNSASAWRGHPRLLLAGGLTPDNVADAVAALRPHGVDVASGVESAPGIKDAAAVRRFVRAAKGARAAIAPG